MSKYESYQLTPEQTTYLAVRDLTSLQKALTAPDFGVDHLIKNFGKINFNTLREEAADLIVYLIDRSDHLLERVKGLVSKDNSIAYSTYATSMPHHGVEIALDQSDHAVEILTQRPSLHIQAYRKNGSRYAALSAPIDENNQMLWEYGATSNADDHMLRSEWISIHIEEIRHKHIPPWVPFVGRLATESTILASKIDYSPSVHTTTLDRHDSKDYLDPPMTLDKGSLANIVATLGTGIANSAIVQANIIMHTNADVTT